MRCAASRSCSVLALAGCGGGPDADALKNGRRASASPRRCPPAPSRSPTLERRGSQSDTKAPAGETRRIVYFDAELKLERDFDFGAWDSPGVAGLVSALGAGPEGHRRHHLRRQQGGRRGPRARHRALQARGRHAGCRSPPAATARPPRRRTRPTRRRARRRSSRRCARSSTPCRRTARPRSAR